MPFLGSMISCVDCLSCIGHNGKRMSSCLGRKIRSRIAVMVKKKARSPLRYWGIAFILFAFFGWFLPEVGPMWMAIAATVGVFYTFFQMPLPCGAWNRGAKTRCRNNSPGLLPGCHIEQHRWQTAKLMVAREGWGELRAKTLASWKRALPAVVAAATIISGFAAVAQLTVALVVA